MAIGTALAACTAGDCPPGQVEAADGQCVSGTNRECTCGDNTHFDFALQVCLADYPTVVCGPGTIAQAQGDGTYVCERVPEGVPPLALLPGAEHLDYSSGTAMPGTLKATACCGPGTESQGGGCVASSPQTTCDPLTTIAVDTNGMIVCEPIEPGACPSLCNADPDPGMVTICGKLIDTETNQVIGGTEGGLCDPSSPALSGPCAMVLKAYDALAFAGGGGGQLSPESIQVNECGEYAIHNVRIPQLGFVAVSIDDSDQLPTDDYVLSGVALDARGGGRMQGVSLYAVTRATDDKWTQTASDPFAGRTFSEAGAIFMVFLDAEGQPAPGVQVTVAGGAPQGVYYFSDSDPFTRATVDPVATMTGPNGAALVIGSSLSEHSGTGAEPAGCVWESALATSLEGVIFATERRPSCL